jgi:hypothetical protein
MTDDNVGDAAEVAKAILLSDINEAEQEEAPSESEDSAAPEVEEVQETDFPDLDAEIPEDILEALEVPDEEDEDEEEEEEEYEYEDAEELKRKLTAERKKRKFLEDQKIRQGVKAWKAEAIKYFPFSESSLDNIQATSRRSYLKAARAEHEKVKPIVQRMAKVFQDKIEEEKKKGFEQGRAEAQASWGKPTTGPGAPPVEGELSVEKQLALNEKGGLAAVYRAMMDSGKL